MKKYLVGFLAIVLCFTLVGCGDKKENNTNTNSGNGGSGTNQGGEITGTGLDNVTESNYGEVMKKTFGIDPIYGDGWTIKEVKSPNKVNNLKVNYKTPNDIDPKEWTKKYFDATVAVSEDGGVYGMKLDMNTGAASKGEKITNYADYENGDYWGWYYTYDGREIQFTPSIFAGDALVTFVLMNNY